MVAPAKTPVVEEQKKKAKKGKEVVDVKDSVPLDGMPLIEDLINKVQQVESKLPFQMSQQHQTVLQQLKMAIQSLGNSMISSTQEQKKDEVQLVQ